MMISSSMARETNILALARNVDIFGMEPLTEGRGGVRRGGECPSCHGICWMDGRLYFQGSVEMWWRYSG